MSYKKVGSFTSEMIVKVLMVAPTPSEQEA